jgi:hypothetical protein
MRNELLIGNGTQAIFAAQSDGREAAVYVYRVPPPLFGTENAHYTQNAHTLHFVAAYVVLGRFVVEDLTLF